MNIGRWAWILVFVILFSFTSSGYCANYNVQSNTPQNNQGYIFISTGQKQGGTEIGTWTDPTTIPTLKGDKGDKGDTGSQGIRGFKGDTGATGTTGKDGINGIDGKDGINGMNGNNGLDGKNGLDGAKGDRGDPGTDGKDVDPIIVTNLQNEDIILQNNIDTEQFDRVKMGNDLTNNLNSETTQRISEDNKLQSNINSVNSRVDSIDNKVKKLETTQYKMQLGVRILDTRKITIIPYISQDFTRNCIDETGIRITFKLGTSYEEREINKTNKRINDLETYLNIPEIKEVIEQIKMKNIKVNTDGKSFWIKKEF
jgi:hypothetical protein